jgi:hypothetical protein
LAFNGLRAEVDADAVGGLQRRQQLAAAAPQFQHPFTGRNQKAHELAIVFTIGGVEPAGPVQLVAGRLKVLQKLGFPLILRRRVRDFGNHNSLEWTPEFKTCQLPANLRSRTISRGSEETRCATRLACRPH